LGFRVNKWSLSIESMNADFCTYLSDNQLIGDGKKILVAVSGGIDSIVLCSLFKQQQLNFAIGHCNFKLRGQASDGDEKFVQQFAEKLKVPFHSIAFETEKIAQQKKQSIQVAARELRYNWFEKIKSEQNYDFIATAHHLSDSIETVFYNFTKGCGIRGLHGILPKNGKIIRPLLFATKKDIEEFAQKNNLKWREDASNATDKYARNKIRHHIIPLLKELNPAFEKTAHKNIERIRETEAVYDFAIQILKDQIIEKKGEAISINIQKLLESPAPQTILFEILRPFQFNNLQIEQILQCIDSQNNTSSGKMFFNEEYCLLVDRDFLFLNKKKQQRKEEILIHKTDAKIVLSNEILKVQIINEKPNSFSKEKNEAVLDLDKLNFPLILRKWKIGDTFQPFGMQGKHQKVSDFFSNNKLSRFEKEAVWILESKGEIVWIVGLRMDERFKLTNKTKNSLLLVLNNL